MNHIKNTLIRSCIGLAFVAACGDDSMELGSRYLQSELVTADSGGRFTVTESDSEAFAGVGIDVPAGAVAEDTTITVAPSRDLVAVDDAEWVGPAVEFGPSGLVFATPVTATLRVDLSLGDDRPAVRVVSADGAAEWIDAADITINADETWSFPVSHFTTFQPAGRPQTPACTADADCASGDWCVRGACTTPSAGQCRTDADCATGEACTAAGTCAPTSQCTTDADCASGDWCMRGTCITPSAGQCRTDADCATGEACTVAGMCAPTSQCTTDADCASGDWCMRGTCITPSPGQCRTDTDCAQRETCNAAGRCEPTPQCRTSADCGPGQQCVRGTCVP